MILFNYINQTAKKVLCGGEMYAGKILYRLCNTRLKAIICRFIFTRNTKYCLLPTGGR
ncbi:MAG: hypothetical protein L6V93_06215 [Clostridiales bacterium]|nr:MAG: hypothetical protein L6V93_06215 [Clostridiales bacterium]